MKITVQLEPADLVRQRWLTMRPRKSLAIAAWIVIGLFLLGTGFGIYEWITTGHAQSGLFWTLGLSTYFALLFFVFVPWQAKRIFRQQKDLQRPSTIEFTDEGVRGESENGKGEIKWSDFHKWKANRSLILLFYSDALCNIVPTRSFADAAQRTVVLALIESKLGKQRA